MPAANCQLPAIGYQQSVIATTFAAHELDRMLSKSSIDQLPGDRISRLVTKLSDEH